MTKYILKELEKSARANANNNAFRIKIKKNLKNGYAIFLQELYELRKKRNIFYAIWAAFINDGKRDLEYGGHEVEVQAFKKYQELSNPNMTKDTLDYITTEYRLSEAKALLGYPQFEGKTLGNVFAGMVLKRDIAKDFVEKHWDEIPWEFLENNKLPK